MTTNRKLAAIMFTDIVGYTKLMGENEREAMQLLHKNRKLHKSIVKKRQGKWLKEMGDGAMAQFGSALDAVNCALEIQRTSRAALPAFSARTGTGIKVGSMTVA